MTHDRRTICAPLRAVTRRRPTLPPASSWQPVVPAVPVVPATPVAVPFCNTTVPMIAGFVLCGVMVRVVPATQYEYVAVGTLSVESMFPEVW